MLAAVKKFSAGAEQSDDITMLAFRYLPAVAGD
jgi:serine phosphatase RsbU (regulator of sigma subunit)